MIFVTVGTQLPFDRLVRAVDEWAQINKQHKVFAQVGDSKYRPKAIESVTLLSPEETLDYISKAEAVVAHAGMGSIIAGLRERKPIIVMPRRASLGEHRSDHQVATARRFAERGLLYLADDGSALNNILDNLGFIAPTGARGPKTAGELTMFLSAFLRNTFKTADIAGGTN